MRRPARHTYVSPVTSVARRFFLVERYVPSISADSIEAAVRRLNESTGPGGHHLVTLLIRGEETCLSVLEAPDVRAVGLANERAQFDLERVVEVEVFGRSGRKRPGR
jgi:hypothetical protein